MAQREAAIKVTAANDCCPSLLAAPLDSSQAAGLATGFSALGDPVRVRLISMLADAPEGEICVCEFIGPIGKSQGTISHHLKILTDAGLVHGERRGRWVWYSLDRDRLGDLRNALDG